MKDTNPNIRYEVVELIHGDYHISTLTEMNLNNCEQYDSSIIGHNSRILKAMLLSEKKKEEEAMKQLIRLKEEREYNLVIKLIHFDY